MGIKDDAVEVRAQGWRTLAALSDGDDPAALGCSHKLVGSDPQTL